LFNSKVGPINFEQTV